MIDDYLFIFEYVYDDKIFVARVAEFPSLIAHGKSLGEAQREIRDLVEAVVADLVANGEAVPVPLRCGQ